jgi:CRP/FNR family transcriptional regulator, cyclic AMP receptor protein
MKLLQAKKILWGEVDNQIGPPIVDRIYSLVKNFALFSNLSPRQIKEITHLFFPREYQANEFVFEVGQPGAALFIIQDGEVSVEVPDQGNEFTQIAIVKTGQFVGELALLDNSPRSASARALRTTHTFALFRNDLNKLAQSHPEIAVHIYRGLATLVGARLKKTNELIHEKNQN